MYNHKNIILPHTFHNRVSYVSRSCLCKNAERNSLNSYNNKSQKKKKLNKQSRHPAYHVFCLILLLFYTIIIITHKKPKAYGFQACTTRRCRT